MITVDLTIHVNFSCVGCWDYHIAVGGQIVEATPFKHSHGYTLLMIEV